ncbi:MAG: DMT family transporter [Campylobacterota bacterium]|nr:DMT family transporter [Campylobacterota bacterium]
MVKLFIGFLVLLAGVASSTQGLFNGYWKDKIDLKTILLVNSLVVFAFVTVFYLLTSSDGVKFSFDKMSPSIVVGGICGFFIILVFAISFPSIGALATSLLFIIAFLITSMLYDHFGILNLTPRTISIEKIIGIILVIFGTFLSLKSSI